MPVHAAPTDALPAYVKPLPADTVAFCAEHELLPLLDATLRRAHRLLAPAEPIDVELMLDPEGDDQWLVLTVVTDCGSDESARRYREYITESVTAEPRDPDLMIRLVYDRRDGP